MRYIIEVKNKKADEALAVFLQEQGAKNVDIITSYEPVERLTKEVEKVDAEMDEKYIPPLPDGKTLDDVIKDVWVDQDNK